MLSRGNAPAESSRSAPCGVEEMSALIIPVPSLDEQYFVVLFQMRSTTAAYPLCHMVDLSDAIGENLVGCGQLIRAMLEASANAKEWQQPVH